MAWMNSIPRCPFAIGQLGGAALTKQSQSASHQIYLSRASTLFDGPPRSSRRPFQRLPLGMLNFKSKYLTVPELCGSSHQMRSSVVTTPSSIPTEHARQTGMRRVLPVRNALKRWKPSTIAFNV